MKNLKYVQFAQALGIARASVTMAIKNNLLIADTEKKLIDIDLPQNKSWVDRQTIKGHDFNLSRIGKAQTRKTTDPYIKKIRDLDFKRKLAELEKTNNANKVEEIRIRKLQGELIPVDAVKSVFIYSVETVRTILIQESNALANIFVERLGASNEQFKELQKDIMQNVNEIIITYKKSLLSGLENIIKEYKEVRSRGERK